MTFDPPAPSPTPTFHPPPLTTTGAPNTPVAASQSSRVTPVTCGGFTVVFTVVTNRCSIPDIVPEGVEAAQPVAALLSASTRTCSDAPKAGSTAAARKSATSHATRDACHRGFGMDALPARPGFLPTPFRQREKAERPLHRLGTLTNFN